MSSRTLRVAAVPLMLAAGALLSVQSQINGDLATELGGTTTAGLTAAVISFGTGLVVVAVITLSSARRRAGIARARAAVREGQLPWPALLAGLFGGFLVAGQSLTVGTIGVAMFTVAMTAGQAASGLAVDHTGLGPSGRHAWSVPRAIAASFAVMAVVLAAGERLLESFSWKTVLFAALPLVAGAGSAVQSALNGRISHHAGPWVTSLNNFAVGFAGLVVGWAVSLAVDPDLAKLPDEWWLYLGGPVGLGFVWLSVALVRVHGVLVLGLCMIAGQVIAAELIEIASGDAHVGPVGIAAGGLTVLGVGIALLRTGTSRTSTAAPDAAAADAPASPSTTRPEA